MQSSESVQDASDLETALQFVTRRINEEAIRSGKPLSEEESYLLGNLPTKKVVPHTYPHRDPEALTLPPPRDLTFERLCELATAAYQADLERGRNGGWQLAKAVMELHHHPMAWLLGWARIKTKRPGGMVVYFW